MSKIIIDAFVVESQGESHMEPFKMVSITPEKNKKFEFVDSADLETFVDDLRQTFERVMPFGCEVKANASTLLGQLEYSVKKLVG